MLNTYPAWKYIIIVGALLFGLIYALPNIYLPDYAVQVSAESSGGTVSTADLKKITNILDDAGIEYFGDALQGTNGLVRLPMLMISCALNL